MASVNDYNGVAPKVYKKCVMTYDGSNNMESATYYDDDGDIICVLAFTYDGSNNLLTVERA